MHSKEKVPKIVVSKNVDNIRLIFTFTFSWIDSNILACPVSEQSPPEKDWDASRVQKQKAEEGWGEGRGVEEWGESEEEWGESEEEPC